MESPDVLVTVENPACGDVMQLALRISDGRITDARFKTRGCVSAIACSSFLTELIIGLSREDARKITREQIVDALGGLPEASVHASHLVMDALAESLRKSVGC